MPRAELCAPWKCQLDGAVPEDSVSAELTKLGRAGVAERRCVFEVSTQSHIMETKGFLRGNKR